MNTDPINDKMTSGSHHSYWNDSAEPLVYNPLDSNTSTEVLAIGGGIAGLTTAYCLSKSGKKVILLEDGYLGSGESGRTTAKDWLAADTVKDLTELEPGKGTIIAKGLIRSLYIMTLKVQCMHAAGSVRILGVCCNGMTARNLLTARFTGRGLQPMVV